MSVIDEVKQRVDIVEVIGQYASLKKAGRTFRGLCPFHSEKHPSFFVYPEQQSWHCFGTCNTGGDAFSFIMKKESIDFGEALRLLAQRAGVTIPSRFEPGAEGKEKERLYQANQTAVQYFHNLLVNSPPGKKAQKYVTSRRLSPETVAEFQLGYSSNSWDALKQYLTKRGYTESELLAAGLIIQTEEGKTHDRFRNRLMFPISDARGRTTGFGARALDDSEPKYLNSPQTPIFDKSHSLYAINLAAAAIRQQNMAVIVEGYMDVITAHQNGFKNVVASMGTSVTEKQVSTLKRLTRNVNVILALDADAAGDEAMLRSVSYENILDAEVKFMILPRGKDPDNVIREDQNNWQQLVATAPTVVDYAFNTITSELDLNTARGKSLAAEKLIPIVAEIKKPERYDPYLNRLSKLTGMNYKSLEAALGKIKASQGRRRIKEPKPEAITRALRPLVSSPLEEYCLALLLQHPELKGRDEGLLPEYFDSSENREISIAWQQADDTSSLKDKLDAALHEEVDALINRILPANQIERKYANCVLRLKEKFLRNLAIKREEILALEAEAGGTDAELAKLEEQGIEVSVQLGEVFAQKARRGQEPRR
ncbi:MAG: DNA primase [Dehalococcoidales bacterium]|nr:DNA primase [Dehalococcoidales bacterium]